MSQQALENTIEKIKGSNLTKNRLLKYLQIIVKALSQYSKVSDKEFPQTLIPCCLFVLPERIHQLLELEVGQCAEEMPYKLSVKLVVQLYLSSLHNLLIDSSEEIKHIIVQGMSRSILLTIPFSKISKRWVKSLVDLWAKSNDNINLCLRCHLVISKFMEKTNKDGYMWALRRVYVAYFEHTNQISWRTMEHINFMVNSLCELVSISDSFAYYVMFGYIRSISMKIDQLYKAKKKERIQLTSKLYANQILHTFKLLSSIVSRVRTEQLSGLMYPLVELMAAYERISQSAEFMPLKLHILSYNLQIMGSTGIYIPICYEMIVKNLGSPLFQKKMKKKSETIEGDIQIGYRLSKTELDNTHMSNELFQALIFKLYQFQSIVSKTVGGSQIIGRLYKSIKKLAFSFSGYKQQAKEAVHILKQDYSALYDLRSSRKMSLLSRKSIHKFEAYLAKHSSAGTIKYTELREDQEDMLKRKLAAEDEGSYAGQGQREQEEEDQEELQSGWEDEQQSGASDFEEEKGDNDSSSEESREDVSYEGDPDDADEAIKQWSENQWSSQEEGMDSQ